MLAVVNRTFEGPAPGIEAHELTSGRTDFDRPTNLSTDILIATGENTEAAERIESLWVARHICELTDRFQYRDMAILTRANMALGELQRALDDYGFPRSCLADDLLRDTGSSGFDSAPQRARESSRRGGARGPAAFPLFGVPDEEILLLLQAGRSTKVFSNGRRRTGGSSTSCGLFETASAPTNCSAAC